MASPAPVPRWRLVARGLVLGTLVVAALVTAGNVYEIRSARSQTISTVAEAPRADVAIVLGNLVFPSGAVSAELAARLKVALDLYRTHKVGKIYVSGAYRPEEFYDEPSAMAAWLRRRGVPDADVALDRGGYRTAATMADAYAEGIRDAILCTQAYHLPRALFLARHIGLHATGVPADHKPLDTVEMLRPIVREGIARPESVLEVFLRGVRGKDDGVAPPKS
ncbi:MAG TPA: YdcF family protein [Polyangia bacterium]|nr:YdcF family protein [Polyangia bacterium]